jgi:hypothetical protein
MIARLSGGIEERTFSRFTARPLDDVQRLQIDELAAVPQEAIGRGHVRLVMALVVELDGARAYDWGQ